MTQNWLLVRKNQINHSKSKETYAFSKDRRFNPTPKLCDSFYNIPSKMGSAQATGIGKGNKISIVRDTIAPSPQRYNIKSPFQGKIPGGKIGVGRQNLKYGGIIVKSETPEPGRYSIERNILKTKNGPTMKIKLKPLEPSFKNSPGPAHYNCSDILNKTGRSFVSNIKNCSSYKIVDFKMYDAQKHRRFPGPGHYEEKQNLKGNGQYFNSRYSNSRCRIFSKSSKKSTHLINEKVPGPGAYKIFSEFGCK